MTVEELASHTHPFYVGGYSGWAAGTSSLQTYVFDFNHALNSNGKTYTGPIMKDSINPTGGNVPHNNMEPYRVVYIFKRTV